MKKHIVYASLISKNKVCVSALVKGGGDGSYRYDSYRQYHISPREAHELARSLLNIISENERMPHEKAESANGDVRSEN